MISGERVSVSETQKLRDQTWWEMRPTNLVIPMEDWVQVKAWIIKMCKQNKNTCDKEVSTWERSIDVVDEFQSQK